MLLLAPFVIAFLLFFLVPAGITFWMSLTESSLTRTNAFVGLANYAHPGERPLVLGLGAEHLLFRAADRDSADGARAGDGAAGEPFRQAPRPGCRACSSCPSCCRSR
jgi:hypothetical protein